MITLGATTWSEHQALLPELERPLTLSEYAAFFPTVEVDTFFYAIPAQKNILTWQKQVPATFQFVVKAHRSMTGHLKEKIALATLKQTFQTFKETLEPLRATRQLKAVLFQFPPFFTPNKKSINYLRQLRIWLPEMTICLEFRNKAWYSPETLPALVKFCQEYHLTLTAADEPSQGQTSILFKPLITTPELCLLRLHGRNQHGWSKKGPNWRRERTLYHYSELELTEFKTIITKLEPKVAEICVIFNNNSGGDAAKNALTLQKMLNLKFTDLAPKPPTQLNLL